MRRLAVTALALLATLAFSPLLAGERLESETHFRLIEPPVAVKGDKAEIVEVFNFKCPHCYSLHKVMAAWSEANKGRYAIKSLPIFWGQQKDTPVRAYYAADFLGRGEAMKHLLFKGHFDDNRNIEEMADIQMMAEEAGLDGKKFQEAMASFGVMGKVAQGRTLAQALGVNSTPTVVVNGKFAVSPDHGGGEPKRMLEIVEELAAEKR